jgi:regulator of protease activity HflC (stomatin/prohibitin superfamily)
MKRLIPLLSFLLLAGCATVEPGRIGVLWTTGGGTRPETYREGAYSVAAWNQMYIYDLRTMSHDEKLNVIASNGLGIKLDASVRYHIDPLQVVALQEEIGPEYYSKILEPVLRSEARRVIGQFTPEEVYSTKRDMIERQIREGLLQKIEGKHIILEAILIRDVELPEAIRRAIDQKLQAEQEVLKMKYVLEVAKSQAEERKIEAQAIADYNRTITSSLNPAILEFERIQQLGKLATSSNSKTVVMAPGTNPNLMVSVPNTASKAAQE